MNDSEAKRDSKQTDMVRKTEGERDRDRDRNEDLTICLSSVLSLL